MPGEHEMLPCGPLQSIVLWHKLRLGQLRGEGPFRMPFQEPLVSVCSIKV